MNVILRKLANGNILVTIAGSSLGKVIKPDEAFHGIRYKRLVRMGDGKHWLKEKPRRHNAGSSPQ